MIKELYISGDYLLKNPTWHVGESPWKAKEIIRTLERNHIAPKTICEVGCGAGEVLRLLQMKMESECIFSGYEISPQAFELSKSRENERLHFKLQDFMQEKGVHFDLILVLDVLEHMENPYDLLRDIKSKSPYKIIQFPLDISVRSVLRDQIVMYRETYGHIHYFTKSVALRMLEEMGYEVLDCFYTSEIIPLPWDTIKSNPRVLVRKILGKIKRGLLGAPGKLLFVINQDLAERIFGGWRLLILAR
jgi:SAM-dependent methyltransferase